MAEGQDTSKRSASWLLAAEHYHRAAEYIRRAQDALRDDPDFPEMADSFCTASLAIDAAADNIRRAAGMIIDKEKQEEWAAKKARRQITKDNWRKP